MKSKKLKIGLIQLLIGKDKLKNVERATKKVIQAAQQGCSLVCLPECFNSPYGALQNKEELSDYVEDFDDSPTLKKMAELAKKERITLVAGSIPTLEEEKIFNTSCVFDKDGKMIAKHQKIHLFDINVPGKIVYEESKIMKGGNSPTTFVIPDTDIKVGLGICFDIRFSELALLYQRAGCSLLIYPGAFNMTTGPAHWKLLIRARSVDNQCYVAACSPARDEKGRYVAWGHSMVSDPWGTVLEECEEKEQTICLELDFQKVDDFRSQLPVVSSKEDFYGLEFLKKIKEKEL